MSCRKDVEKAVLNEAFDKLNVDRVSTFKRVEGTNDEFYVTNTLTTKNHFKPANLRNQAHEVALDAFNRVKRSFNGHVSGWVDDNGIDPIRVKLMVNPVYVNHLYNLLPENRQTDPMDIHQQAFDERQKEESARGVGFNTSDDEVMFNRDKTAVNNVFESKLLTFLGNLGISVEEYNELKSVTGFDAIGTTDLLNKVIGVVQSRRMDALPKEVAYVAYSFLGKKNKIRTDLIHSIDNLPNYNELYNEYHRKSPTLSPGKIRELIVIDFLTDAIKNNFEIPQDSYSNRKSSYWQITGNSGLEKRFKYLLMQIKNFINNILGINKLNTKELLDLGNDIANDVLAGNMDKYATKLADNQRIVNYQDTLKKDPKALQIVEDFQKLGLTLTGSLALRKQGSLYRTDDENLHDLDFTVQYEVLGKDMQANLVKLAKQSEGASEAGRNALWAAFERDFLPRIQEHAWFKAIKEKYPEFVIERAFSDKRNTAVTVSGRIGEHVIDLFIYDKPIEKLDKNEQGIQDWQNIFKAKIQMGRAKDILDFVHFQPTTERTELSQEAGFRHFTFEVTPTSQAEQEKNRGSEIFTKVADALAAKLGIQYEVISEAAAMDLLKDAPVKWNGEKAFTYRGRVYILEGGLSSTNAIHEYSHFFIAAIVKNNPTLFSKLYSDFILTAEGAKIDQYVRDHYSDFSEAGIQEEVLVRGLTARGQLMIKPEDPKGIFSRIWFAIKQILRDVFGKSVQLSKLNENTTLNELAEMLMSKDFQINSEVITAEDVAKFNRDAKDMADTLLKVDPTKLGHIVDRLAEVINSHVPNIMSNSKYKDIRDTLTAASERNDIVLARDLIKRAQEAGDDIVGMTKKASQLAHTIDTIDIFSSKILDRIRELNTMKDHKERLSILSYYGFILGDWSRIMDELSTDLRKAGIPAGTELYNAVTSIRSKINDATKEMTDNNQDAVFDVIKEMLLSTRDNIDAKHEAIVKLLEAEVAKGTRGAARRLEDENKQYQRFDLSDENILKYMRGEMGDSNRFSAYLEAYISSGDPIIGGFSKFLKTVHYGIEVKARQFSQDFRMELAPLYKKLGVDRSDPAQLGMQITFTDKVLRYENGKPVEGEVLSLINQFKNYRYDLDIMQYNIDKAKQEGKDDDARALRQQLNDHLTKYFHREYVDDYYRLQDIWKTPAGLIAYQTRKDLYDDISTIQDTYSNDPLVKAQQMEEVALLRKKIQQLGSLRDSKGNPKTGNDLLIAQVIKEYNTKSKVFYESKEIAGLFESRYNQAKQDLLDSGLVEGSEEFTAKLNDWISANTRQVIDPLFYIERESISTEIAKILATLPSTEAKNLDQNAVWKEILEIVSGFRDADGQPIGTDFNNEQIEKLKLLQEKLLEIKDKYNGIGGLNKEESAEIAYLYHRAAQKTLTKNERLRLTELKLKKGQNKLSRILSAKLKTLSEQLGELSSKVATDYYTEIMNNYLSKVESMPITNETAEGVLVKSYINPLLEKDPEFKKWFLSNHILKSYWNNQSKSRVEQYERLYIWNRIVPNNDAYKQTYKLSDGTVINGMPTYEYYRRQVASNFRTKREVGVNTDNAGNWLPKNVAGSPYINERYNQLKASNPDMFSILQIMTKYHLKAQEGLYSGNKLGYDIPRFRKNRIQYLQEGTVGKDAISKVGEIGEGIKAMFAKREDDFNTGNNNYEDELHERLASTDMFDNEISRVPIKGLAHMPIDQVSLNVGESIVKYMVSGETNKKMIEISPLAKALINVVEENGVKDITAINRRKFTTSGIKMFINSDKNIRATALNNLYEREFQGIEHNLELGAFANKAANQVMRLAAFGSLALDMPGAIKNVFAATVQSYIESMGGKDLNVKEFAEGNSMMLTKFIPGLIEDYNKMSGQGIYTQMFQMFDPVQGSFKDKLGHELSASNLGKFVAGHWAFSPREFGEIEAQGAFWAGMMIHQKVDQVVNGETKQIRYMDAFEIRDGKTYLKDGIDKEWGEGGKKFMDFKLKMHELNQRLQGNYAAIDQAEIQRYTSGRLFNFMRRYLVPAAVNRFSGKRIQVGLADTREGYYITAFKVARNFVKDAKLNWHLYTDEEKANVWKTLGEIAISLTFMLLLRSLGWDPNDKDKYKKLQDNSWATNMLIYELMAVKSESEQFIPIPGMGADELMRLKNTPSIAFGHFDKYYRILNDALSAGQVAIGMEDPSIMQLQAKQGYWDKGDYKILTHLARLTGFTGGTIAPEVIIKNFNLIQSKTK